MLSNLLRAVRDAVTGVPLWLWAALVALAATARLLFVQRVLQTQVDAAQAAARKTESALQVVVAGADADKRQAATTAQAAAVHETAAVSVGKAEARIDDAAEAGDAALADLINKARP